MEHSERGLPMITVPAMQPELGARALLVEASEPSCVIWLDGVPAAVSDENGWAVVLLRRDEHRICESLPKAMRCRGGRTVVSAESALLLGAAD